MIISPNMITKYSPINSLFERDMMFHKMVIAGWDLIQSGRRVQQIRDNAHENRSRANCKYTIGDKAIIITTVRERGEKLFGFKYRGPCNTTEVHHNETATIRGGNFDKRINIRRLKKYKPSEIISAHSDEKGK